MKLKESRKLFKEAQKGQGSRIYDADNNCYVDYVMSWGALILGYAPLKF